LWKFLRKRALSRWHKTFEAMQAAVSEVLDQLSDYRSELDTLMTEEFHIVAKEAIPVEYREVAGVRPRVVSATRTGQLAWLARRGRLLIRTPQQATKGVESMARHRAMTSTTKRRFRNGDGISSSTGPTRRNTSPWTRTRASFAESICRPTIRRLS